jgi:hypothetical protein
MRILVLHGICGDRYFLIKDDAHLFSVCIAIIKERLNDGYRYVAEEPLGLTKQQIDNLPSGKRDIL